MMISPFSPRFGSLARGSDSHTEEEISLSQVFANEDLGALLYERTVKLEKVTKERIKTMYEIFNQMCSLFLFTIAKRKSIAH